jgi:hypothetical protein
MQYHVVSANEWLYPDIQIPSEPTHNADLHVARGGRTALQILLRSVVAGAPVFVTATGDIVPEVYQLIDVNVAENSGPPCSTITPDQPTPDYVVRKAPYRVYEALRPVEDGDPSRGETEAIYVSYRVPLHTEPGDFSLSVRIDVGGEIAEVSVHITVHKASVPELGHLRVTNWFSLSHIARHHELEPWSEAHWGMIRQYAQMMRRGRQTDFIPVAPERQPIGDGKWDFDFSRTERMIRLFLDEGFTHIECPHFSGHDRRKEATATFVIDVEGQTVSSTSHEAYVYFAQYLTAWREFLQRNGWYERAIQHIVDEPPIEEFDNYKILAGIVRKFLPGVPIIDALGDPRLDGAIDIWVPLSDSYENVIDDFEAHRERGDTIWFYTCCAPSGFHLNRYIDTELLRTRLLHWGNWRYRIDGYLHWGLNQIIEEQHPFENTTPPHGPYHDFHLPPGDSHIVYPGESGPWSSVRFEAMAMGIEDYELLHGLADRDEAQADALCAQVMRSFTDYNADVPTFEAAHRAVLEAASKI